MPPFDTNLQQMAHNLLNSGSGIPAPLNGILQKIPASRLLKLTLESTHGTLLTTGTPAVHSSNNERNIKALPALSDKSNSEKRFFFSMSDKTWEVLSAFTLKDIPYFTTLTLDITRKESTPLRAGLFKLSDYFTVQCRKNLQVYINSLVQSPVFSPNSSESFVFEKNVLYKIANFSDQVQCAVLLDEDG